MYIQHILVLVLKIQIVLPCVNWVEPLDTPEYGDYAPGLECCEEISWGNQAYSFVSKESTKEYNCNSPCIYTRVDIPHSRYCFKDSGNVHTECQANSVAIGWYNGMAPVRQCVSPGTNVTFYGPIDEPNREDQTCFHVTESSNNVTKETCDKSPYSFIPENSGTFFFASGPEAKEGMHAAISARDDCFCQSDREPESLSKLSDNLKKLEEFFHKPEPSTFNATMTQLFKLHLLLLSQDQVKVLRNSSACSEVGIECEKCFKDILEATLYCGLDHNPTNSEDISFSNSACKNGILASNASCRSCFCEISHVCFPYIECKRDVYNHTVENTEDNHPCDRKCEGSDPLRCVYNFNLTNLESNGERPVLAYNGQIPGPQIVICEGDELVVNLQNNIIQSKNKEKDNTTTLHFHGIREMNRPWSDGVPWVSQVPIAPGENFKYGFKATKNYGAGGTAGSWDQAGTYWYHSHVKDQRTNGAYGALIIKPKQTEPDTRFDVDEPKYTIILQEWYESYKNPMNPTITRLLVNGHGRVDNTSFAKFEVLPNTRYMFRIIGAISEDVPLRLSIDNHTFTAITTDSQDIQPVHNLTSLWVAGGERFHIVVQTKEDTTGNAYKIKLFGYADIRHHNKTDTVCTTAWLKYPGQTVDTTYRTPADCTSFDDFPTIHRTLNPVPNNYNEWENRLKFPDWQNNKSASGYIYIGDLRAVQTKPSISVYGFGRNDSDGGLNNTNYLELNGNNFNGLRLNFSAVPILLQNETYLNNHKSERCGQECNLNLTSDPNLPAALRHQYLNTTCSEKRPTRCKNSNATHPCHCEHVMKQPYAPGYWVDILLINNDPIAHPIHIHGGWFWVMRMDQFNHSIDSTHIKKLNHNCSYNDHCLWTKNLTLPVAKDTIQVPTGGYVLLRIPLDNKGAWLMHCHINKHLLRGMAMVLQIGGFGHPKKYSQDWCTGPLEINGKCKQDEPP